MKYVIYARKSTEDEDRQILSIEAQLVELKEFAAKEKLEIVKERGEPACGRAANYGGLFSPPAAAKTKADFALRSAAYSPRGAVNSEQVTTGARERI